MRAESVTLGFEELNYPVTSLRIERGGAHSHLTIFINNAHAGHITVRTSELQSVVPLFVNMEAADDGTIVILEEICRQYAEGELPEPYEPKKPIDDPLTEPNMSIKWIEYYKGYSVKRVKVNDTMYFYGKTDDGEVIKGVSVADVEVKIDQELGAEHERATE